MNCEKKESIEIPPEILHMLKSSVKNFKTTVMKMFNTLMKKCIK